MRYLSLQQIKNQTNTTFEWRNASDFLSLDNDECDTFISLALERNNRLYIGWIEQTSGLEKLLLKGSASEIFKDTLKIKEHILFADFQKFVTLFLSAVLLKATESKENYTAFSYIPLLEKDARLIIEDRIYKHLKIEFNTIKSEINAPQTESELIKIVNEFLSEEKIILVNSFSRSSYALKINYVENVLSIISAKSCTQRLAHWILKQLEKLELNEEHIKKINLLKKGLTAGEIKIKNVGKRKVTSLFNIQAFGRILATLIGVFTLWIIIQKPWSKADKPVPSNNTSYKTFSIDERKKIDSLLQIIQPRKTFTPENYDLGSYIGEELELVLRTPLKNNLAERYYTDLSIYAENYYSLKPDSCLALGLSKTKKMIPNGMLDLNAKLTGKDAFYKNESTYDLQVIVFKNFAQSEVYYGFVPKGKKAAFKIGIDDLFYIVPGSFLKGYNPPKHYPDPKLSPTLTQSFCEIDVNFIHGINTTHQLKNNSEQSYKFLLVGSGIEQFQLFDIQGVLLRY
jgi:hypothetical protein